MMLKKIVSVTKKTSLCFCLLGLAAVQLQAQSPSNVKVHGTVYDAEQRGNTPLDFVSVAFPDYAIGTTTDANGHYSLSNIPLGKARMRVTYLGKLPIDTLVNVTQDMRLDFSLHDENFKIKEIVVTATSNEAGKATSSSISRTAMDHLQATSLSDLMSLLPGGLSTNPSLNSAQQINIRQVSSVTANEDLNGLGTAIIRDGAPISNNANLSSLNPTVAGSASALAGGASPSGGTDVRSISTENIESVEVIRGIPSVEYGDLTSGAVIIRTKAGREPLRIKAKANPNVYQASMGTGFDLGGRKGALNVSADYAYNINDPRASYQHYQRATARVLYSNVFFNNKLRSNTSLDFTYGKDTRDRNPDDERTQTASDGRDAGFTFNTNGTWNINHGWLQNLRYVASATYTDKSSFYEQVYSQANSYYSMTTTDGAILSNTAGQHLYDADGNEITHFGDADAQHYAQYLPASYKGRYDIDSKEINIYAKLTANLFKRSGNIYNRILFGADFKSDGNRGDGKTFSPNTPPYRNLNQKNASFRPRAYKDIPFINQVGAFAEENFNWQIGERNFTLQAGVRYDHVSVAGGAFSPRANASFDIIPHHLTIRGGYGITAKMPTLLYLYPEKAYFEYANLNELANEAIPEDERLLITTTRVFDVQNRDLKIAKNHKAEVGFDLRWGQMRLGVTAYQEKLKNGYSLGQDFTTFRPVNYDVYERNEDNQLVLSGSYPVLADYYKPGNNRFITNRGIEFDLDLGRIDAIRTAFSLTGAWMRTESWNNSYVFYDESGSAAEGRTDVALYAPGSSKRHDQQFATTLRATHNIPSIGFVVTLSAQAVWQEANWTTYGNDSIPLGYLSVQDASVHMFEPGQFTTRDEVSEAGYDYLLRNVNHNAGIKESYSPYFNFNINVTKEISDNFRVSFFANNMFRSYPRRESKRNPGDFTTLNNRFFFGLELSLTL